MHGGMTQSGLVGDSESLGVIAAFRYEQGSRPERLVQARL